MHDIGKFCVSVNEIGTFAAHATTDYMENLQPGLNFNLVNRAEIRLVSRLHHGTFQPELSLNFSSNQVSKWSYSPIPFLRRI